MIATHLNTVIVTVDDADDAPGARLQTPGRHVVHLGHGGLPAQTASAATTAGVAPALVSRRGVPNAVLLTIAGGLQRRVIFENGASDVRKSLKREN